MNLSIDFPAKYDEPGNLNAKKITAIKAVRTLFGPGILGLGDAKKMCETPGLMTTTIDIPTDPIALAEFNLALEQLRTVGCSVNSPSTMINALQRCVDDAILLNENDIAADLERILVLLKLKYEH